MSSLVRCSDYDADIFYKHKAVFIAEAPYAPAKQQNDLRRDMELVLGTYFPLNK